MSEGGCPQRSQPVPRSGLAELVDSYDAFILDQYGVVRSSPPLSPSLFVFFLSLLYSDDDGPLYINSVCVVRSNS